MIGLVAMLATLVVERAEEMGPGRGRARARELQGRLGLAAVEARGDLAGRLLHAERDMPPAVRLVLRRQVARWLGESLSLLAEDHLLSPSWVAGMLAQTPGPPRGRYDRRGVLLPLMARALRRALLHTQQRRSLPFRDLDLHEHGFPTTTSARGWWYMLPPMDGRTPAYMEFMREFWRDTWTAYPWSPLVQLQVMWFRGQDDWLSDWVESGEAGDWRGMEYGEALAACIDWHAALADRQVVTGDQRRRLQERAEVVRWSDGWTLRKLSTPRDLDDESAIMRHCVGAGSYDDRLGSRGYQLLSLHDPGGEPRVTIEVRNRAVAQVLGRRNAQVSGDLARVTGRALVKLGIPFRDITSLLALDLDQALTLALACLSTNRRDPNLARDLASIMTGHGRPPRGVASWSTCASLVRAARRVQEVEIDDAQLAMSTAAREVSRSLTSVLEPLLGRGGDEGPDTGQESGEITLWKDGVRAGVKVVCSPVVHRWMSSPSDVALRVNLGTRERLIGEAEVVLPDDAAALEALAARLRDAVARTDWGAGTASAMELAQALVDAAPPLTVRATLDPNRAPGDSTRSPGVLVLP